jgi:hypothetical protein
MRSKVRRRIGIRSPIRTLLDDVRNLAREKGMVSWLENRC